MASRRLPEGSRVELDGGAAVEVGEDLGRTRIVRFESDLDGWDVARLHGHVPLPPYIRRDDDVVDHERYQTVFARAEGSVAAPTAGLHFDSELLRALRSQGVEEARVTLHVGPGTFLPVDEEAWASGLLHEEFYEVPAETVSALHACRERSGRVVAVGTTVCRTLESLPADARGVQAGATRLFIRPPHEFRWVDALVTNFHLPKSSLIMLVAAFAGDRWREAYRQAVARGYRFYSYGDANFIEKGPA